MASLRKVLPGQSFRVKASDWNVFVDAARAHRDRLLGQGLEVQKDRDDTVPVRNTGDSEAPLGALLWVSGASFEGLIEVDTPPAPGYAHLLCAAAPIPAGDVGRALTGGFWKVRVAEADHAGLRPGDRLGSSYRSWLARRDVLGPLTVVDTLAAPYALARYTGLRGGQQCVSVEMEGVEYYGPASTLCLSDDFTVTGNLDGMPGIVRLSLGPYGSDTTLIRVPPITVVDSAGNAYFCTGLMLDASLAVTDRGHELVISGA